MDESEDQKKRLFKKKKSINKCVFDPETDLILLQYSIIYKVEHNMQHILILLQK